MFTVDQIKQAHSKVRSGKDFPSYIQDLKRLGVTFYQTYVEDGHTDYFGNNDFKTTSAAKYDPLKVEEVTQGDLFKNDLLVHQQGKTNFLTFCHDCAKSGIARWDVCLESMTCTYYDKRGDKILVEEIPGA